MAQILITGAGGFIGRRLQERLVHRGDEVRSLQRRKPSVLAEGDVEFVLGDVRDSDALDRAVQGVDAIFHLAAVTSTRRFSTSREINVGGTRRLAEAAARCSTPPRLVHVSSLAAAGPCQASDASGQPIALAEADPCHPVSIYGKTKRESEQVLAEFASQVPISVVRPACVFGPGDRNLLELYRTVIRRWNFVISRNDQYSFVYIEDLIDGFLQCLENGATLEEQPSQSNPGTYFLASPERISFVQLADQVGAALGVNSVRHLQIPRPIAWTLAAGSQAWGSVTGQKVFLNTDKVREGIAGSWLCDSSRASRDFGWKCREPIQQRILETTDAYRELGWINL